LLRAVRVGVVALLHTAEGGEVVAQASVPHGEVGVELDGTLERGDGLFEVAGGRGSLGVGIFGEGWPAVSRYVLGGVSKALMSLLDSPVCWRIQSVALRRVAVSCGGMVRLVGVVVLKVAGDCQEKDFCQWSR
jgi:hypothetical protein